MYLKQQHVKLPNVVVALTSTEVSNSWVAKTTVGRDPPFRIGWKRVHGEKLSTLRGCTVALRSMCLFLFLSQYFMSIIVEWIEECSEGQGRGVLKWV